MCCCHKMSHSVIHGRMEGTVLLWIRWYMKIEGTVLLWIRWYMKIINSLWPCDTIWQCISGSTLAQVMPDTPSHNMNHLSYVVFILGQFYKKCSWHVFRGCTLKLLPPLPGANELTDAYWNIDMSCWPHLGAPGISTVGCSPWVTSVTEEEGVGVTLMWLSTWAQCPAVCHHIHTGSLSLGLFIHHHRSCKLPLSTQFIEGVVLQVSHGIFVPWTKRFG